MTDLETREDDWARSVFDRVRTGQDEPHWTPDATTAARLSNRRRIRIRMTSALASVAIVGLSATAFTTLGGNVFRNHSAVSPGANTTTWTGLDLTKYLEIDGVWKSERRNDGELPLSATGLTTVSTVLQRLDPGLKHMRTTSGQHQLTVGPDSPSSTNIEVQGRGYWAPQGDISTFPRPFRPFRPATPFGYVTIIPLAPQQGGPSEQVAQPDSPCGLRAVLWTPDQVPGPIAWSDCSRSPQSDGSDIVVAHSTNLTVGTVTFAERLFPDGSSVQITASSVIGHTSSGMFVSGPPLNPVPWTDAGLVQALTGPNVKGLS